MATQRTIDVGTVPVQVLPANPRRKSWYVQFLSFGQDSGNTGRIFVARGFRPVATENHPSQGQPVTTGGNAGDNINNVLPKCPYLGDIWVVAENASQTIEIFESDVEDEKPQ